MKVSALSQALLGLTSARAAIIQYSTVTGYFPQDESSTDASTFHYAAVNFGLINRTYAADRELEHPSSLTQWERFYHQIQKWNEDSSQNVEYKGLFLGRHGEGWHNAAESYYGTPAWNCYWAELNGNTTATWYDASLTEAGTTQALIAHNYWQSQVTTQHIHTPDKYYPLTRTLQTANLTFSNLSLPKHSAPFKPLIKEHFREGISIHTCDHRHNKSYIHSLFPSWTIEPGFSEEGELWNGVTAERSSAQDDRSTKALGQIFFTGKNSKEDSFVHQEFSLSTGAVIPVLVRAEMLDVCGGGSGTSTSVASWTTSAHCTQPPVTSVSSCVCPSSTVPVTMPLVTNFLWGLREDRVFVGHSASTEEISYA